MKKFKSTSKNAAFDMIAAPVSGTFETVSAAAKASLKWVATYERSRYIVKEEDESYKSIPCKHLSDVSYTGSRNVVAVVFPA